jgi:glycine C-acetyltransferase
MYGKIKQDLQNTLEELKQQGLYKTERIITSSQSSEIEVNRKTVLNFCANNYLGLANHPEVVKAAQDVMNDWGFGLSSVRFICGTQQIHKELEYKVSEFLGTEDTILYCACFDANGGVFEPLLGEDSAIISDELNHASIIDGVRLCKAQRFKYKHSTMEELEQSLKDSQNLKYRLIVTDGVFSMDGDIAKLPEIVELADKYDALVMVDDSHATGYIGKTGRGTAEYYGLLGKIDIITTTFGKGLGGASGGCVSGRKEIVEMCRQKARPYLFSNTIAPPVVAGVIKVLEILSASTDRRDKLEKNTEFWRKGLIDAGLIIKAGDTPIVPVMLFNAKLAQDVSRDLYDEGIYAIGFFFPVVPQGQARIRTQISAGHEIHHLEKALDAFRKVGKKYDILGKSKQEIIERYGM